VERFFYLLGIVPARFIHPDWAVWVGIPVDDCWPFLTSMFLHGGWQHIIGNMWTLWIFGDNVEDRMGPIRFLAFYLLSEGSWTHDHPITCEKARGLRSYRDLFWSAHHCPVTHPKFSADPTRIAICS
jgi:hypothetical protein